MFIESVPLDTIIRAIVLATLAVCWVVFVVRIIGLRAFSKMTAFDFVVTVATGSLLAGACQATDWPGFFQASIAISALLGVQYSVARLRKRFDRFEEVVQNSPVLLMEDGRILDEALASTRVAREDLIAKLREANVMEMSDVRAVVLETTGNISVLQGNTLSPDLLEGVEPIKLRG